MIFTSVTGKYYAGKRSVSQGATLSIPDENHILIKTDELEFLIPKNDITISDKIGSIPRRVSWGDSAYIVCDDNQAFADFTKALNLKEGSLVSSLENKALFASVALVIIFASVMFMVFWGIPKASYQIAHSLPDSIYDSASEKVIEQLDDFYLSTSTLTIERQEELRAYFLEEGDPQFDIHFRDMDGMPNAFSVPGGDIVFTDALVELAETDEELLAVYFHELGHSLERHSEQMAIQQSSWAVLLIFLTGDVSGVTDLLFTIPLVLNQMSFSRHFEREADDIAFDKLVEHGHNTQSFSDILTRLSEYNFYDYEQCYDDGEEIECETVENLECNYDLEESDIEQGDIEENTLEKTLAEKTMTDSDGTSDDVTSDEESIEDTQTSTQITEEDTHSSWGFLFDYLSTHPPTKERIERFEEHAHE